MGELVRKELHRYGTLGHEKGFPKKVKDTMVCMY